MVSVDECAEQFLQLERALSSVPFLSPQVLMKRPRGRDAMSFLSLGLFPTMVDNGMARELEINPDLYNLRLGKNGL